jgi:hypothetical protein
MFEKSLNELIKGIRAHKGSEAKYIDAAIADCRKEVKSKDPDIKAKAVLKLAYVAHSLACRAHGSCKCTGTTFLGGRSRSLRLCLRRR